MNDATLTELKVVVERAVRPIRASNPRKRRMREELLGHLTTIYEDELGRLGYEQAALEQAGQRFGDPRELTEEFQGVVPKWDRVRSLLDKLEFKPGESLLHLAGKHLLGAFTAFAVALLLMLPVIWIRGRLSEIGLVLHIVLVMGSVMAIFSFLLVLLVDRITRARYGIGSERSLRVTVRHCLASVPMFPGMVLLTYWGLGQPWPHATFPLLVCLIAPLTPVLLILLGSQAAEGMRHEEEWTSLEIEE